MAKKVIFTDDLEDTDVEADAGTISFALDNNRYEIDLSTKNAQKLRNQLGPYIAAARQVGKVPTTSTPKKPAAAATGGSGYSADQLAAIRDWARNHGFDVAEKGRIRKDIMLAFEQENRKAPALSGVNGQ